MLNIKKLFDSFCTCCGNEKYHQTQDHKDKQCPIWNKAYVTEDTSDFSECEITGNLICSAFRPHNWRDESGNLIEPRQKIEKNPNQLELL